MPCSFHYATKVVTYFDNILFCLKTDCVLISKKKCIDLKIVHIQKSQADASDKSKILK